jgi:hypothetical protein
VPILWRRIAWFVSFATALAFALWMRSADYGWPATLAVALLIWFVLPFVISQLCAAYVLGRHARAYPSNPSHALAEKIAAATKGLPPEEQERVAKRIIDESLK